MSLTPGFAIDAPVADEGIPEYFDQSGNHVEENDPEDEVVHAGLLTSEAPRADGQVRCVGPGGISVLQAKSAVAVVSVKIHCVTIQPTFLTSHSATGYRASESGPCVTRRCRWASPQRVAGYRPDVRLERPLSFHWRTTKQSG